MIRELLSDIFSPHSSFGDRCSAALMVLFALVVIGVLGLLVFAAVDSVGIHPTRTAVTVIEAKHMVPAHTTITIVPTGKVVLPVTTYHPTSYSLRFEIEGKTMSVVVDKDLFDVVNTGDQIEVDYGFGRLSRSLEPTHISPVYER